VLPLRRPWPLQVLDKARVAAWQWPPAWQEALEVEALEVEVEALEVVVEALEVPLQALEVVVEALELVWVEVGVEVLVLQLVFL